jgi:alkyl hydroperoxide reductase subunit F
MNMLDTVIIGGGPAGISAGVYAARKKMKAVLIAESLGGSSAVSSTIENWIGIETTSGWELAQSLERHLRAQEGIEIVTGTKIERIEEIEGGYAVISTDGKRYEAKTVIVASGVRHRHLGVPGEEEFRGKGVVYCSTCDAPFFKGKRVAVIGGGNSGLEAVEDLFPYASTITLLSDFDGLSGDPVLQEKVLADERVTAIYSARTKEIFGEGKVEGLRYEDATTGEKKELETDGVFVEIGMVPNSEFIDGFLERNKRGEIVVDARNMSASKMGIFAAGDVTDLPYRQNNIAAGEGAVAALAAYDFVRKDAKED